MTTAKLLEALRGRSSAPRFWALACKAREALARVANGVPVLDSMPSRATVSAEETAGSSGLTRRTLLLAGAGAVAGSVQHMQSAKAVAAAVRRAPPLPGTAAQLLPVNADVWGTRLEVVARPSSARLTVGGQRVTGSIEGQQLRADVPLKAGANEVRLDGGGSPNPRTRIYTARRRPGPTAQINITVSSGAVELDATTSQRDAFNHAPIVAVAWRQRDGRELGAGERLLWRGPWSDGEHYVMARVTDAAGNHDDCCSVFMVAGGVPAAADLQSWQPRWAQEAIVYGVIPPLFGSPPLQAVTADLGRLRALGVDTLWLSPIFATTPGDFGYAVTDHFAVRPDYGTLADLQALVAAAHALEMRVILDLPLNDTSVRHPYFEQAKHYGPRRSRYWDFYQRDAKGRPVHYFEWRNLANLNYDLEEVRLLATEAAAYWLREANVDGFRCDAAWGVQERRPDFWAQWQRELRRIRPDLLLIAEGSARESDWARAGFSAAYDWTGQLGEWAWTDAFSRKGVALDRLSSALAVPTPTRPFRFLENNDTGRRFIGRFGPDLNRAASALLFSLPGIPCVYTGQEIGAEFRPYSRSRPLNWDADPEMLESTYRGLIANRRSHPSLSRGQLQLAAAVPSEQLLAFTTVTPEEALATVVNFSDRPATGVVTLPDTGRELPVRVDPFSLARLHLG